MLARTTAFGYFPHNLIGLNQRLTDHLANPPPRRARERLWQVRARSVVLATGAIERPLIFPGNDRPGIMLSGAAQTYLNRYGVRVGSRAVIVTCGDPCLSNGTGFARGRRRHRRHRGSARRGEWPAARGGAPLGVSVLPGSTVIGTDGGLRVAGITLGAVQDGRVQATQRIACDAVLMSGGFTPSVHLFSQSRGKLEWREELSGIHPGAVARSVTRSAGACRGIYELAAVLADGAAAGAAAASCAIARRARRKQRQPSSAQAPQQASSGALPQATAAGGEKAFVDWQHDVTTQGSGARDPRGLSVD